MRKLLAAAAALVVLATGCSSQGVTVHAKGEPLSRPSAAELYFPALTDLRVDMKHSFPDMNWEDRVAPAGAVEGCVDVVGEAYGMGLPEAADTKAKAKQVADAALAKHGFAASEVKNEEGKTVQWQATDSKGSVAVIKFGGTTMSADVYYPAQSGECMK